MPAREVFSSVRFLSSSSGLSLAWVSCMLVRSLVAGLWSSSCGLLVAGRLPWLSIANGGSNRPPPNLRGTEGVAPLMR